PLVDHRPLGVTTVGIPPRVPGPGAEILPAGTAPPALPARVAQPCDAGPIAGAEPHARRADRVDRAHDLVAGHDCGMLRRALADPEVPVGASHAARRDAHTDRVGCRFGHGALDERERTVVDRLGLGDDPGLHTTGSGYCGSMRTSASTSTRLTAQLRNHLRLA